MTLALPFAEALEMPPQTAQGTVVATFKAEGEAVLSRPVEGLQLDFEGIPGTRHHGFTRAAGAREPWYGRGTPMRSGRQLTVVSEEELAEVARRLEIRRLDAGWIGANVLIAGIPELSWLPTGTRLVFPGAVLVVEGQNAPCRYAGEEITRQAPEGPGRPDLTLGFPKHARGLRGLVATVERPGRIAPGDKAVAKVPLQRLWRSA